MKKILAILLMSITSSTFAAQEWHTGLDILSIEHFNNTSSGFYLKVVVDRDAGPLCQGVANVFVEANSSYDSTFRMEYTTLLTAFTGGYKVDLLVDTSACTSQGRDIDGVRISKPL